MEALSLLLNGFETAFTFTNVLYCLIGVTVGMLVGVMPGLGPTSGTAILIPLTFGMDPVSAIIMLSGIYYGAMYGGTITSVLINTPGESASVVTCIDGYEMAKRGRAGAALGVAAIGSFVGGTVAIIGLTFIAPMLAGFALKFGAPEFFSLMLLGLMMLIALMGKSIIKGLIAALFGFLLALIGMDPITGEIRFTYHSIELVRGIDFVIVAMGLFGISEILSNLTQSGKMEKPPKVKKLFPEKGEWKTTINSINRGTVIGFLLGLIPGSNAAVASLMSYALEKKTSKNPSKFGKGAIEGVAGPETANNAFSGSALIPLFTLGLPSSPTVAVLLGAFILHGLTPGPMLFTENSNFVWAIIASLFIGNFLLLIMNLPMAGVWAKIALVPYKLLFPLIVTFAIIGAYSINNSLWDVGVMMLFGLIGYFMKKLDFPLAATILTFVLARNIESSLVQTLKMSHGSLMIFLDRPISATIIISVFVILIISIVSSLKNKRSMLMSDAEI